MSMTYEEHHRTLVEYLKAKVDQADWHRVIDAACDLLMLDEAHYAVQTYMDVEAKRADHP